MSNERKQKKKNSFSKKVLGFFVGILIGLSLGLLMGYLTDKLGEEVPLFMNEGESLFIHMMLVGVLILIFLISFLLHIIIHELGHLVFGLSTGYSFVSFRIGSLVLIKEEGKFKLKKYAIPGTAGQCLMMPPDMEDGDYPYVIYNLGGVMMNFIIVAISIISIILIKDTNILMTTILILFALAGVFLGLTNGIPLKISGLPNDGYNVISIKNDDEAKRGFYLQLKVYGLLSKGMRYRDMDHSMFQLQEGADISNPFNTSIKILEYEWFLDNMDFDSARSCIESFSSSIEDVVQIYAFEINCERIFMELIGECNKDFIDKLYNKELRNYIKQAKYMMSKKRLMMAYEAFYNKDEEKTLEYYNEIKELYRNYPVKGDADMELMIADWMIENM